MNEIIGTVAGIVAIAGVICNNGRLRVCFVLWMISNAISAGLHASAGIWSLAARDMVFFVLAIDGWRRWSRHKGKL
jgi:nicotinamide riboside transporter PnuC